MSLRGYDKRKAPPIAVLHSPYLPQKKGRVKSTSFTHWYGDKFLKSYAWRKLRMDALVIHGARCQCCGATAADGVRICVDHIRPRKLFPDLALNIDNLQVLCEVCNHGKGNKDQTDWRGLK
jgi:5-methylcytosine-specific restriction endonuclease McrA